MVSSNSKWPPRGRIFLIFTVLVFWFKIEVLILDRLLSGLKDACAAFPDKRKGAGRYAMADIGLSAFLPVLHAVGVVPFRSAPAR